MKCPQCIKDKILLRAKYAERYLQLDADICDWMQANNIDSEYALLCYVENLCGCYSAAQQTLQDIENS